MKAINTIKSKIGNNLSIGIKQMQSILTASLFAISMVLVPWGTVTAQVTGDAVKWHPGHYMVLVADGKYSSSYRQQVYTELQQTPALRGVVVRYSWGELEKGKGNYDFSNIEKLLDELAARKKRLVILMEIKASSDDSHEIVPDYVKTAAYDGGFYTFSNSNLGSTVGRGMKLWNAQVEDRMSALVRALAKRFNSHPYFEGFGFTETAMGQPTKPLSVSTKETYYRNLLNLNKLTKASFANTMTFQYTNYPRDILESYTKTFKDIGTALAGPDVFLNDVGLNQGLYTYFPKLSGIIPVAIQVEEHSYKCSNFSCSGAKPEMRELLNFARDRLDVNYIFWVRAPGYYREVLELLNFSAQKGAASGGLKAACPSAYPSCAK